MIRDGDFAGVVAPTEHEAAIASAGLRPTWSAADPPRDERPQPGPVPQGAPGKGESRFRRSVPNGGWLGQQRSGCGPREDRSGLYGRLHRPRPLEPRAAVAQWNGDHVTIWTGTHAPFAARSEVARRLIYRRRGAVSSPMARHG